MKVAYVCTDPRTQVLNALKSAAEIIRVARRYFPKSMHNDDKFRLELVAAEINKAIAAIEGVEQ